jgi:membrane protein DedA with SNARE-associated domain
MVIFRPLEAKLEMEDIGQAMFVVLVVALTFVVTIVWAKWNKRKRDRK